LVPPLIARHEFELSEAAHEAAAEASRHLVELRKSGSTPGGVHSLAETLMRSESVASSRIEGLQMSHARMARARHGQSEDKTARDVLANIAAMRTAIAIGATAEHVTPEAMCEIHGTLLASDRDADGQPIGGVVRAKQNWIGGSDYNPLDAAFVPPPPECVPELLADLSAFIDRADVPAIAQAAIAHGQFETIHPFIDGNGRTGRALVYSILRRRDELGEYVPPVSLVLGGAPRSYVGALTAYRQGDVSTIVEVFANATSRACFEAERLGGEVEALRGQWENRLGGIRSHATERLIADLLTARPVLNVPEVQAATSRSDVAVSAAFARLTELRIVKPLNARKWGRGWEAPELFELVERFEKRVSATRPVGSMPDM
jgi:Fic family protein